MIYNWELATGHHICVENQGAQTVVTISSSSAGQQQRSSNSFNTGIWIIPPEILIAPTGATLKITTPSGESIVQIEGNSIRLQTSDRDQQQSTSSSSTSSFPSSMAPMQPLQMGNMQMNLQPMTMKMGNMELNMGETASQSRFCSQCGTPVKPVDKFCASCGHKLAS